MFKTHSGEEIFVIDGHIGHWNGSAANCKTVHGEQFINCFYNFHSGLSPADYVWPREDFREYSVQRLSHDLFTRGYVDMAIFQPVVLSDFYHHGFATPENCLLAKNAHPDRYVVNGCFDPRDGAAGLDYLTQLRERHCIRGVKLYTAEWRGESRGYKLSDPDSFKYLEHCEKLGITNIHVHKGPAVNPLNMDAFDVRDVDQAASCFPGLNFIVEHCGLPRLDDFCWIAAQEPNVYGGLSVVMPFLHHRPQYFGEVMGELLFWLGEDRLLFGSDYAIWHPQWLIEKFMAYELPEGVRSSLPVNLTFEGKKKMLGQNAARLYGIDIEKQRRLLAAQPLPAAA